MLNGDGNENSNKIITSNWHKNKFARAAHFSVHFFYGGIVVCAHQKFSYLCSCSPLIFFSAAHFHLASLRHFSFSHRCYEIFVFFFQRNSSPMFLITHSSSFSVIHVSVDLKNNVVKDTTLLLFFLS